MDDSDDVKRETTERVAPAGSLDQPDVVRKRGIRSTLFPPGRTPGVVPRARSHCRRWWWCDCLVLAAIVLIIVLPIVYVAIPKIAQHDVNASTLEIQAQIIGDPTPSSVHLKLVNIARSDSSFHPTLDKFRAALFLESTEPEIVPFGYVEIPKTIVGHETEIIVDQTLAVTDMGQFIRYNEIVMGSDEFRIAVRGRTGLHLKGLSKIDVDYNKVVTMKGLDKLKGFNITEFQILTTPEPDGSNMNGTVSIPNQSVLTLDLGNVTMDLSVQGQVIGQSVIPDLVLKPGSNVVPMRSTVNQSLVIGLVTEKFTDGLLPVEIVGNSSVSNGQHLQYFEAAIVNNPMLVTLDVGSALAALGLNITQS